MSYIVNTDKGYFDYYNWDGKELIFTHSKHNAHTFYTLEGAMHFDDYVRRGHGATMTKIEKAE